MQRILLLAAVAIAAAASSAQANPRGAASKIEGQYTFDAGSRNVARMTAPVQSEARRSYSFDSETRTAPQAAPTKPQVANVQPRSTMQPARRFSYEPGATRRVRIGQPKPSSPRYLHADAKVLGHFDF